MVSFTPTPEQQQLIDTVRRYAANDIRPITHESDEGGGFPASVIDKGWQIGLVPTAIPEALGGLGEMSALTGALAAEELAFGDLSAALAVMTPALFAYPVSLYGTEEQREVWLPPFLEEKAPKVTAALLEPGIFFDAHDLKTTATLEGAKVRLNGAKAYVPLAGDADMMLVYAKNSETGGADAYLVGRGADGLEIEGEEKLMGLRALSTYRVKLNDVRVDLPSRLGGAAGFDYQVVLNRSRVALAALAVGVARASFEYARDYAKERQAFGAPIATKQAIAFMLAEAAIEVDAARLMVWEAAWQLDQGQDASKAAYLAKQYADKAALTVTDSGVQVLGGYGFIREYPVERWLRNARGFTTFEGLAIV
ncbi:MAG: acyl-CoA dehydrogenase family protein [Anaerolineae bacterium]|nr:acyl-CoA dehydrogenase family protein [Anaerolineae bacterium]